MKGQTNKPTIKDVAKRSGVSAATVSKILNDLGGYSEETRERVLKVVEETGYERNEIARNLKIKATHTIGVLLPKVDTIFYFEILNGIEDYARQHNYTVVVCNVGNDSDSSRALEYIKVLSERQVDGIIICSLPADEKISKKLVDLHIPSILVSTFSQKFPIPYVKVDDYKASYAAATYLIEKGHRKIAMIGGVKQDPIAGIPRLNGFIQALKDNNIPVNEKLIKHTDFNFKDGIRGMQELLEEKEEFTAIFAACDDIAVGAMAAAYRRGLKVPEDISIIGYDNTKAAEMSYPPLTTAAQPLYEMGKKAIEMLLKSIGSGSNIESVIMPFKIIERETVKTIS